MPATPPATCGRLGVNAALAPNQAVTSCNGRFTFVHQGDGNVVLYDGGRALWNTRTNRKATSALVMQDDGNFVLYSPASAALWNTRTAGHSGATLAVQDDGNVVLYGGGRALWNTGTCCR
jgi:hypothetical protein